MFFPFRPSRMHVHPAALLTQMSSTIIISSASRTDHSRRALYTRSTPPATLPPATGLLSLLVLFSTSNVARSVSWVLRVRTSSIP